MDDDQDFLKLSRFVMFNPDEPLSAGDRVTLESLRDDFWSVVSTGGTLSDIVGILTKIRNNKPNFEDRYGIESRIAFYHRLSIRNSRDISLLGELLALQLPQRKRDLSEVPRLIEEVLKVESDSPQEQRQRLQVLAMLAHQTHPPDGKVLELLFDECLKFETRDAELEELLLGMYRCSWAGEKPNCSRLKTLVLRHFASAEKTSTLKYSDIGARCLKGICEASEVASVAEEIFRIQQTVTNYYPTNTARAVPEGQRLRLLAWDALGLANIYFNTERFDDAERICIQAINWYGAGARGEADFSDRIGLCGLRIHLSKFRIAMGKFDEAKTDLIQILKFADPLTEDDYGDSDVYRPWSGARILLARVYIRDGEPDKAEKLLLRVKEEPGFAEPDLPGLADAISELKSLYKTATRPDYAGKLKGLIDFEDELQVRQNKERRDMDYNTLEGSFINCYPWLDLLKEGRDYIKSLHSYGHSASVRIQHLCELAEKCLDFDQYQLGIEAIDEALLQLAGIQSAGSARSLVAGIKSIRSRFFIALGNCSDAEKDIAEVQDIRKPGKSDHQFASADLGLVSLEMGRYEDAERRLAESCGVLSKTRHAIKHLANLYFHLGYLKFRRNDLSSAKEELERAAKLLFQNSQRDRDETLRLKVISLLALIYNGIGREKEASMIMQYALGHGGLGATRNLAWILVCAGVLSEKKGEKIRAGRLFGEAQSLIDELGLKRGLLVKLVRESMDRVM
jgi:tetratricopeptide (TPR) repeat protein